MTQSRPSPRRSVTLAAAALLSVLVTGCSASGETRAAPPGPAPVGLVAIGHSGLTGENTDPALPHQPASENSWATGTSPQVDSVYLRLVAARPKTEGHVANTAQGGAPVTALAGQLAAALKQVRSPELVIIQTIDSDIRCDGSDPGNLIAFGQSLAGVLTTINDRSPRSKILLVGQLGRPSPAFVTRLVAKDPAVQAALTGDGMCDFYTEDGELNTDSFTTLTSIIAGYEARQARVCAKAQHCRTDGGTRAAYVDRLENFTDDWAHINVRGQAQEAKEIWPMVASFLGVR